MKRGDHVSRAQKPRIKLDFDDNRNSSILIKQVKRDHRGRPVEDILPRHPEYSSESETSSSEGEMGKHRRSREDRAHAEEQKAKRRRHKHKRAKSSPPGNSRLDRYFSREPAAKPQGRQRRSGREGERAPRKTAEGYREPAESEEEAPPDRVYGTVNPSGERVQETKTLRKNRTRGTSITPGRFVDNPTAKDAKHAAGHINLTLNVCGAPAPYTVVEKTSGITIQCNHPQANVAPGPATSKSSNALGPTRVQPSLRGSPPVRAGDPAAFGRNAGPETQRSEGPIVHPQNEGRSKDVSQQAAAAPGPSHKSLIAIPLKRARSLSPRSIHLEDKELFREENFRARLAVIERELSQSRSLPQTLTVEREPMPAISTPLGPPREPMKIVKALEPSSSKNFRSASLKSAPISESARRVMFDAFVSDCATSRMSNVGSRGNQTHRHPESRPADATPDGVSSHERHASILDRPTSRGGRSVHSQQSLGKVYDIADVQNLAQKLLSSRPKSNESVEDSSRYQKEEELPAPEEPLPQPGCSRGSNAREVNAGTGPRDEQRSGFRTPPDVRSVVTDERLPTETESLHIPVVITEQGRVSNQQSFEVQMRDSDVNRERVSSCFAAIEGCPSMPSIIVVSEEDTRVDRCETITIDDVRRAKLIGQFARSFLVLSKDPDGGTLFLIDQHALHERILLEELEDECFRNTDQPTPTCILAPAIVIRVRERAQMQLVERDVLIMERHGFLVKPVRDEAILIQTAPRCLSTRDVERLRRITTNLFQEFIDGSEPFSSIFHRVLKSRACHSAIKCPQALSKETQKRLVREMPECRLPFQCCHGRPSITPISANTSKIFRVDSPIDREDEETPPNSP